MRRLSFSGGEMSRTLRSKRVLLGGVAVAAVASSCVYAQHHKHMHAGRPRLHASMVEALAGALGEVTQIAILYPLDTIKVRCQSASMTAAEVIKELLSNGGINLSLVRTLYAGVLGATLCSVLVGSVHYASYEACRRHMLQVTAASSLRQQQQEHSAASAAGSRCNSDSSSLSTTDGVPTAAIAPAIAAAAVAAGGESGSTNSGHAADRAAASGDASTLGCPQPGTSSCTGAAGQSNKMVANVCASVFAALVTALVESPIELFRHNQQAGTVSGNFLGQMVATMRTQGPAGLYWGFLPHCFEAWPHDVTELLVYGRMKDFQEENASPSGRHHALVATLPHYAWDFVRYGAAGASAVLVSMPFDAVKTYMQTHGTDLSGKGFLGSARLFISTGRRMVARKGIGCLYFGVLPRLLQQVPSAMVCWSATEAVVRALMPYTLPPAATTS